ncbi:hypothetical protein RHRU231_330100 [Rhodococcus ruber]|uniref:Uncharacterized protein n=1 Tax=Rhodococcus ruber TaxID=1830 RepID=A0A098BFW7_9NOCA|nr:hypothetical protein RHRU231_330100 [Rhodococcus ruber]
MGDPSRQCPFVDRVVRMGQEAAFEHALRPVAVGPPTAVVQRAHRIGQGIRVEGLLVVCEHLAGPLLVVEPATRGDHRRTEVVAGLEPAGMGAEPVGQDGHRQRGQVLPQLVVGEVLVHTHVDARPVPEGEDLRPGLGGVPVVVRIEDLVVDVDPQLRARQVTDGVGEDVEDGEDVHVGAQALRVHPDDERLVRGPVRAREPGLFDDVWVGQDGGGAAPHRLDPSGGALGEGDQFGGGGDQDVELLVVGARRGVVRVAQVVHGVDERDVVVGEFRDHVLQGLRFDRVEAEVDVEHVELGVVGGDPSRLEHQRRPPSARYLASVGGHRIGKPHHLVVPVRSGQMPDVDVRRGHRGHSDHVSPSP